MFDIEESKEENEDNNDIDRRLRENQLTQQLLLEKIEIQQSKTMSSKNSLNNTLKEKGHERNHSALSLEKKMPVYKNSNE